MLDPHFFWNLSFLRGIYKKLVALIKSFIKFVIPLK